ncbi:MAG: histidine kinase dimerization/phosphoacceptor domain -containing protein [Bacteroidota bacterium]|nr:histidine kinase dimerization/phosphoacceptor domain -containing protein [Bacteroidota bacterium]
MQIKKQLCLSLVLLKIVLLLPLIGSSNKLTINGLSDSSLIKNYNELSWQNAYSDATKAKAYADSALQLALKINNKSGEAEAYSNFGVIYDVAGDGKKALDYYFKALKIEEQLGHKISISRVLNNIGALYFGQEQFELALRYFRKCLLLEQEIGNYLGMVGSYINIGVINKNLQNYPQALRSLQLADSLNQGLNNIQQHAFILANLGSIELVYGKNYDKAIVYFSEAATINLKENNLNAYSIALNGLSETYIYQKKYQQAIDSAEKAKNISHKIESKHQEQRAYLNLANAYEALNNHKQALEFFKKYNTLKEEIINEENFEQIAEAEAKFENEQQGRELAEKEVDLVKSQRRNIIAYGIVIILVALALFIGLLYRRKQKSNLILTQQKIITEKALKDREVLLQEIHHRVKNNLQIVSSLLNLQSRKANQKQTSDAIKEATSRLKSVALLHQNLYMNENLQLVNAKDYIQQLVNSLYKSYKAEESNITVTYALENIELDIDTILPVGLIVNELVTNAFKYAFEGVVNGDVKISLQKGEKYILQISDNGVGFDNENKSKKSFGSELIVMLAEKLDAQLNYFNNRGTTCVLEIPIIITN